MEHELKLLVQLQNIDQQIFQLEKLKGNLPNELLDLQEQITQIHQTLDSAEGQLESASQDRRRFELELKSLQEQLVKYRQQIYAVKSNKEYDAITAEIETTEIQISDLETQILQLMESESTLRPKIAENQNKIQTVENRLSECKQKLTQLTAINEKELTELTEKRNDLLPQILRPLLANYERIRKGKGGIAVVPIVNGSCSGCFSSLPAQTILEIKKMNQLIFCQYCGRLLVWVDQDNGVNEIH
ncbi:C4-type zinc ribbon domain-containing protein [candidate division KSB1 bacterium]|nr:C4-type zinc ribbon domain-containing protein [candidate division KSB1 bacterium]